MSVCECRIKGLTQTVLGGCMRVLVTLTVVGLLALTAAGQPSEGLVAYFDFDNGAVPGIYGKAMDFDGIDDGFEFDLDFPITPNTGSISLWFKPDQLGWQMGLVTKSIYDAQRDYCWISVEPDGRIAYSTKYNGTAVTGGRWTAPGLADAGEWTHLVVTADGSTTIQFYVDGELVPTEPITNDTEEAFFEKGVSWAIGRFFRLSDYDNWFDGAIDEVRFYDRALTPSEVADLHCPAPITFVNAASYSFTYSVDVVSPEETDWFRLWVPIPTNHESQQNVAICDILPSGYTLKAAPREKASMLYWGLSGETEFGEEMTFQYDMSYTCFEVVSNVVPSQVMPFDEQGDEFVNNTIGEPFIESDNTELVARANDIIGDEDNPYVKARLIYDWVIDNMTYQDVDRLKGALYALSNGHGECGEYSALFAALCRAVDVPARPVVGFWAEEGKSTHVWAEFYLQNIGWIPVDPTVADDWGDRDYYFGNIDNRRLILSKGYNVEVTGESSTFSCPLLQVFCYQFSGQSSPAVDFLLTASDSPCDAYTTIAGRVTDDFGGVTGVTLDLLSNQGSSVASRTSSTDGQYSFGNLEPGIYYIAITTPLGYGTTCEVQQIELQGIPREVNFRLTAVEPGSLANVWWWKTYLDNLRSNGPREDQFSIDDVNEWGEAIFDHYYGRPVNHAIGVAGVTFVGVPASALAFDDVCYTMLDEDHSSYESKVRYNLLANVLNVASNRMHQADIATQDGLTVSQAILHFAHVYSDNAGWVPPEYDKRNNLIAAYRSLRDMTMGRLLPAGTVPSNTPNIMYKPGGVESDDATLPGDFALHQNYPNPFNPSTEIAFSLPEASEVRLDVFNIAGQKVTTLVDGTLEAGHHTVTWDGSDLASGVYLYRLDAGTYSATKKMVLLK
ncbi:T9SS type A sorting domain-containing protein [candidate division GN15 bacterium]|nr:T9SS type A sorting domain-containing protein [candidate division GN15 bacterium]